MTGKRAVIGLILFVAAAGIGLGLLVENRVISQVTGGAIMLWLFTGIGVMAGIVGERLRKIESWKNAAFTAYRVSFWCLVLALIVLANLNLVRDRQAIERQHEAKMKKLIESTESQTEQ